MLEMQLNPDERNPYPERPQKQIKPEPEIKKCKPKSKKAKKRQKAIQSYKKLPRFIRTGEHFINKKMFNEDEDFLGLKEFLK